MGTVYVGIGHDNDSGITQIFKFKLLAKVGA